VGNILIREETLESSYVPPKLPGREKELALLERRFREAAEKGVPQHLLLTGGIGSGKTALARRVADNLSRRSRDSAGAVRTIYVNCWRRGTDRGVLREILKRVGIELPERGYSVSEMLDVLERGLRREPAHRLIVLDEVSAIVRQETRLVYLLTRGSEVSLGPISLLLIAPEDILPYLDPASRSSFGVSHQMHLPPYDAPSLEAILTTRAEVALRRGSLPAAALRLLAEAAAVRGDARFAIELLLNAARAAETEGHDTIELEDARRARMAFLPGIDEQRLEGLSGTSLYVLLAIARSLRGPKGAVTTENARKAYGALCEELGEKAASRVTFWRVVKQLEREEWVEIEPASVGRPARIHLGDAPASQLELLLEARRSGATVRKP
jgi:cell division control protein 6